MDHVDPDEVTKILNNISVEEKLIFAAK